MSDDQTIAIQAKKDVLDQHTRARSSISAIAELIWNSLDADATTVEIELEVNKLDSVESVKIRDNGLGIPRLEAEDAFGNLGGSWKARTKGSLKENRDLHGKGGKGRFKAFALGSSVRWITSYQSNAHVSRYSIIGNHDTLEEFKIEPEKIVNNGKTGTEVLIRSTHNLDGLKEDSNLECLAQEFALYLLRYPHVSILYDGRKIDPQSAILRKSDLDKKTITIGKGKEITLEISVIEWKNCDGRTLFLCGDSSIPLEFTELHTHTPGFHDYTAYFKSSYFQELHKDGLLAFATDEARDMHPGLTKVLNAGKEVLREHFRERAFEQTSVLVAEWKEKAIYPYVGDAKTPVEQAERKVFDIVAVSVNEYLKDFDRTSEKSKKFTFKLLQQAIKDNPDSLQKVIQELLDLPKDKLEDFAQLLEKTTLSSVIAAAKVVQDRLDFLTFIEHLVFDTDTKPIFKERSQLHRIIANETWIFGEQYNLMADDESLLTALKTHRTLLGNELEIYDPVEIEGKSTGILDLMLGRTARNHKSVEHLVIELKRPSEDIKDSHLTQINGYAVAVAKDERFDKSKTSWDFILISNDMSENAKSLCNQGDRASGIYCIDSRLKFKVTAKTWAEIFEDCRARLRFFQDQLNYTPDKKTAFERLSQKYEKFIPKPKIKHNGK